MEMLQSGVSTTDDLLDTVNHAVSEVIDLGKGAIRLSSFSGEAAPLQTAVTRMNTLKKPLILDADVTETNVVSTGFTVIDACGRDLSQNNEPGRGLNIELKGTDVGTYTSVAVVPLFGQLINVTKVNGVFDVETGDVVRLVDNATIDGLTNTRHAEMAKVLEVTSTYIIIDCILRHFPYFTDGTVFKVKNDKVLIRNLCLKPADVPVDSVTRIASLTVSGAIRPVIDVDVDSDYTTGVALRGCYKPMVRFTGNELRNDDTIQAYGYGVVAYSGTKGAVISSNVTGGRTAYDDGIWANPNAEDDFDFGCTLDSWVTGTGVGTAGATWDTHPYSDGTTFYNTRATDAVLNTAGTTSNAYGYKIRGTNVNIVNGSNNRRFTLSIGNTANMLIPSVNNVQIIEPITQAEQVVSPSKISYYANESLHLLEVNIIDSYINGGWFSPEGTTGLDYVNFKNTTLDFNGSRPQTSSRKAYEVTLDNCLIKNVSKLRCTELMTLKLINSRVETVDPNSSPIELFEGGDLTIVNTGFSGLNLRNGIVRGMTGVTPATKLNVHNVYSLQPDMDELALGNNLENVTIKDLSVKIPALAV